MKNYLIGMVLALVCIPLASCSGTDTTLEGVWTQTNSSSETSFQQANISEGAIEIFWVNDNITALYWAGSYDNSNGSFISENNTERTDWALMASGADTKEFTVKNGVISYEVSALGITTVVELEKTGELDVDVVVTQSTESDSGWRQFLLDYEAWVDSFISLAESYENDPTDISLLTEYMVMLTEMVEWAESAAAIQGELSSEDLVEYMQTMTRIVEKLTEYTG